MGDVRARSSSAGQGSHRPRLPRPASGAGVGWRSGRVGLVERGSRGDARGSRRSRRRAWRSSARRWASGGKLVWSWSSRFRRPGSESVETHDTFSGEQPWPCPCGVMLDLHLSGRPADGTAAQPRSSKGPPAGTSHAHARAAVLASQRGRVHEICQAQPWRSRAAAALLPARAAGRKQDHDA